MFIYLCGIVFRRMLWFQTGACHLHPGTSEHMVRLTMTTLTRGQLSMSKPCSGAAKRGGAGCSVPEGLPVLQPATLFFKFLFSTRREF